MRRFASIFIAVVTLFSVMLVPGRAQAQDELKNTDPDKYYILLDLRNQIVTVFERENGEYIKVVRRFLLRRRTGYRRGGPGGCGNAHAARHLGKIGGRAVWQVCKLQQFLRALLGADCPAASTSTDPVHRRDINAMNRQAFNDMGNKVSHGCVRLYVEDARWLYYYACPGTTIEISASEPSQRDLKRALKTKLSFSDYNAFQKTIVDETDELPNPRVWVTVEGARLRKGSGSAFDSVARLQVGDELEVLIDSEIWVKVRYGKKEGYVLRGHISYQQGMMDTRPDADVLKSTEWLYAEPSLDAEQLVKAPARVSVQVLETTEDGWKKIVYQNVTDMSQPQS
ncbi:MAG: SH3 domain-containing protein [Eubacteriales bacterium]